MTRATITRLPAPDLLPAVLLCVYLGTLAFQQEQLD